MHMHLYGICMNVYVVPPLDIQFMEVVFPQLIEVVFLCMLRTAVADHHTQPLHHKVDCSLK